MIRDRISARLEAASGTVTVENVSVSFEDAAVLDDVSLEADPGEFVGLIGPNGAGKTTCLRTISGALEPDAGSVTVGGVDIQDCSSRASSRLAAVVPQETTLPFSFPIRDVVEMGRHPHRSRFSPPGDDDRDLVERALERTRTARFADRTIDEVSGGERQRVLLARAIAQNAPVLLLDEPTANLDVNHQVETLELVRELVDDGTTAIAAIHDLTLAARYCDRLLLLGDGGVQRSGDPEAVLSDPALADAFDATVATTVNPVTATTTVTALPAVHRELPGRVHVLGAGSMGAGVLARLAAAGIETTVGPVLAGDATAELAAEKAAEYVIVPPFRALADGAITETKSLLGAADAVVIAAPHPEMVAPVIDRLEELESVVILDEADDGDPEIEPPAMDRYGRLFEQATVTDLTALLEAAAEETEPSSGNQPADRTDAPPGPGADD